MRAKLTLACSLDSIVALLSWIFLAAGILFQFFVILSGAVGGDPEPHFWFLAADTHDIGNAPVNSAWTFYAVCPVTGLAGGATTYSCRGAKAALPLNPPQNFDTNGNNNAVPSGFLNTHRYYYLSRFAVAFFYVAIFFSVLSLFIGLIALCTRLGAYLTGFTVSLALFFQTLSTALMTYVSQSPPEPCRVNANDVFQRMGCEGT